MIIARSVYHLSLFCDGEPCNATSEPYVIGIEGKTRREAVGKAREMGWSVNMKSERTLCPVCNPRCQDIDKIIECRYENMSPFDQAITPRKLLKNRIEAKKETPDRRIDSQGFTQENATEGQD